MILSGAELSYAAKPENEKNIIILNSYHRGFEWTDDIVSSYMEEMGRHTSHENVSYFIEYMDWKKYPTQSNLENFYESLSYKYRNQKIDLIVATDDKALEMAVRYRKEILSDAPIVFAGVSEKSFENIARGQSYLTGVIEEADIKKTIELATAINPRMHRIYVIHDYTESGIAMGRSVTDYVKNAGYRINVISIAPMSEADIALTVKTLPKDSIILMTSFSRDSLGRSVDNPSFTEKIAKEASVPVFSLYDFNIGRGAVGGNVLSGKVQGKLAAELCAKILKKGDIEAIPVIKEDTSRFIVDYNTLSRFGLSLEHIPRDSEILNKPLSFMEVNKSVLYSIIAAFILLGIFVLTLSLNTRKLIYTQKILQENNDQLNTLFEQVHASEEKLRDMAYYDPLTKLSNRSSLNEDIAWHIENFASSKAALMIVDIDNFKYINDTMGHTFGDELLVAAAKKLSEFENESLKIYRISGDEFIIWVTDRSCDIKSIAERIIRSFKNALYVQASKIQTSVSIGIACYPDHALDSLELFKNADIAMYEAKRQGREQFVYFNEELNRAIIERAFIEQNLQNAMEDNEMMLHYQPQYSLASDRVSGFEALIRWNSPQLGMVPPLKFIKIAEDSQKIVTIGKWVFEESCKFMRNLYDKGYDDLIISVNISVVQLIQEDFTEFIIDMIEKYDVKSSSVELEITETALIQSVDEAYEKLIELKSKGISIALDDFGTGFSSLSYLKMLPIHTLKIDKSFIDDIVTSRMTQNLVGSVVSLAHSMNLSVVAEGVETREQMEFIKKEGFDKIQGYYFSKPVCEADAIKLIDYRRSKSS